MESPVFWPGCQTNVELLLREGMNEAIALKPGFFIVPAVIASDEEISPRLLLGPQNDC